MKQIWERLGGVSLTLATAALLGACDPVDDDGDGWYTGADNQRVTLKVTGVSAGALAPAVTIDDRIVFEAGLATPATTPVQTRTIGAWADNPGEGDVSFTSTIRVDNVPGTVTWRNETKDFDVTVGQRVVSLRTELERFADPNPDDPNPDGDEDNLSEAEEGQLAEASGGRIGDPDGREILVVVAVTNAIHELTDRARWAVSTVFQNREINLVFADGTYPVDGFSPGQLLLEGTKVPPPNAQIDISQLEPERGTYIPDWADGFTHFMVMADRARKDGGVYYGYADGGHNFIVGSTLSLLGADGYDYQAKTVMHELGHNIGLCHPLDTASSCPTLPAADMDPAVTVMGSPANAANPFLQATQALARPLDYTEAQWNALEL